MILAIVANAYRVLHHVIASNMQPLHLCNFSLTSHETRQPLQVACCCDAFCFGKSVPTGAFGSVGKASNICHPGCGASAAMSAARPEHPLAVSWSVHDGTLTGRVAHWDGDHFIVLSLQNVCLICIEFIQKLSLSTWATKGEERIYNSAGHQAKDNVNIRQLPIG
jgi:hypothetical protein